MVCAYDIAAYDLFADEAITSTRAGIMTLRCSGKRYRELIGPNVEASRRAGRKYELTTLQYREDGKDVIVTGSFPPLTPNRAVCHMARR